MLRAVSQTPSPPEPPAQPPAGIPPQPASVYEQDQGHLKVLSVCYYVMSGISVCMALFFGLYIVMGGVMLSASHTSTAGSRQDAEMMQVMGGMFLVFGAVAVLFILATAVLEFLVARRIVERRSRMLCMVVAALNCLNMPLGTVLGVFTFVVLCRPQVAASFDRAQQGVGN